MKTTKKILTTVFLITLTVTLFSFDIPKDWFVAGNQPKSYDMGIDKSVKFDYSPEKIIVKPNDLWVSSTANKNAATIKSIEKQIKGFGTLMQNCLPDKYLGKRVRMSGYMKSKDVISWAAFWLRIDQPQTTEALSFDNMEDRPIKGTTDWKKYEIVLDVPKSASNIAYGALLDGTGQIWFSNIQFEIVDNSAHTTGSKGKERKKDSKEKSRTALSEPSNLDFGQ